MPLFLKFDQQLERSDGDKWIFITPTFTEPQILIEYSPSAVPETWDYLGRIFQQVLVENRWAIIDQKTIWPNRPNLVVWERIPQPYRCELRLVRYLKPGRMRVWGVTSANLPTLEALTIGGEPYTINGIPYLFLV